MGLKHTDTCIIPEYALCYLAYGDKSRMTELDIVRADSWMKKYDKPVFDFDEEEFFCSCPAFGLPCECVEVHVWEPDYV